MKSKSAVSKKASAKAAIAEVMGNITNPLGAQTINIRTIISLRASHT